MRGASGGPEVEAGAAAAGDGDIAGSDLAMDLGVRGSIDEEKGQPLH
jgi:hypothetical protein